MRSEAETAEATIRDYTIHPISDHRPATTITLSKYGFQCKHGKSRGMAGGCAVVRTSRQEFRSAIPLEPRGNRGRAAHSSRRASQFRDRLPSGPYRARDHLLADEL